MEFLALLADILSTSVDPSVAGIHVDVVNDYVPVHRTSHTPNVASVRSVCAVPEIWLAKHIVRQQPHGKSVSGLDMVTIQIVLVSVY